MTELAQEEISKLDQVIDNQIQGLPLLSRPRTTAIVHLLLYFDDFMNSVPDNAYGLASAGFDSMEFAIKWIYKFCPDTTEKDLVRRNPDIYREAEKLHSAAQDYSQIWYIMSMLHNRHATANREGNGSIHVQIRPDRHIPYDIAARWLRPTMSAGANEAIARAKASFDLARFLEDTHAHVVSTGRVEYDPRLVYQCFAENQEAILQHAWDLDDTWDVGGYTIGDFRKAWVALTSLAWIHLYACYAFRSSEEKGMAGRDTQDGATKDQSADEIFRGPERPGNAHPARFDFQPDRRDQQPSTSAVSSGNGRPACLHGLDDADCRL